MQLTAAALPFVTNDGWRILEGLEKGHSSAEYVPKAQLARLSKLRTQGIHVLLGNLMKDGLVVYEKSTTTGHEGYRLTWTGYDFLALRVFIKAGLIQAVGPRIGVGKEADVHVVSYMPAAQIGSEQESHIAATGSVQGDGTDSPALTELSSPSAQTLCLKIHRLGRTSFRTAKTKRNYLKLGEKKQNWMHMSCRSAETEYSYMRKLFNETLPVPTPIAHSRHMILMSFAPGLLLNKIRDIEYKPTLDQLARRMIDILTDMLSTGYVHGDFNEFNLIVDIKTADKDDAKIKLTMIDFPQVVPVTHPDAAEYFARDVEGIRDFFQRRFRIILEDLPRFEDFDLSQFLNADIDSSAGCSDTSDISDLSGISDAEEVESELAQNARNAREAHIGADINVEIIPVL